MERPSHSWITSDTHFSHEKLTLWCGRPEDFDKKIFKGLRSIPEGDILYHLGDICIGEDLANHGRWIQQLSCTKVLVRGNHDKKSDNWYLNHGWDVVTHGVRTLVKGKKVLLTHVPQEEDKWFDYNVHGHLHNTDHRLHDPVFSKRLTEKHLLYAQEYQNYQPVQLESMIDSPDKFNPNELYVTHGKGGGNIENPR